MNLLLAIICFFGAAYFLYIAVIDNYAPDHLIKKYGEAFGNSTSMIKWRFLIAAVLTYLGVWLL